MKDVKDKKTIIIRYKTLDEEKKKNIFWIFLTIILLTIIVLVRYFTLSYTSTPKIELKGEREVNINLNENFNDPGVVATLNKQDITSKVTIEGEVDSKKVGDYTLIYSVTNPKNKRKRSVSRRVIVIDNVAPAITLKGSKEFFVGVGKTYIDPGFIAIDNVDGNITSKVEVDKSELNTEKLGSYIITYTVSDTSSNKTTVKRIVRVEDLTKPNLTLYGDYTTKVKLFGNYVEKGYSATDNIDGNITSKVKVSGSVNTNVFGIYYLTYSVSDSNGNTTSKTRTIKVGDQADLDRINHIDVSISNQMIYFYKNNTLIISSPVVTGTKGKNDTPKGSYRLKSKKTNTYLVGPGYRSFVNYWMPFVGQVGLHDASWRDTFGGDIYLTNGSHGCVNLPFNVARTIYNNAPVGILVKVY